MVSSKKPTSKKTAPTKKVAVLKGISAIQLALATYTKKYSSKKNKNDVFELPESQDSIPQTIIADIDAESDENDIPVAEIIHEKSKRAYYFLDHRKIQNKLWGNMIDFTTNGPLPTSTNKPCWWCSGTFKNLPLGCPLRYNPNKTSGIEKERYEAKLKQTTIKNHTTNDFFETEGIFCSFPCCKAYIIDQGSNPRYKDSLTLLSLMFSIFHEIPDDSEDADFDAAPSWKLLKDYGGHLTYQEFRSSFGKLKYDVTVNTQRPYLYSSSQYIAEKKIKMFRNVKAAT